MQWVREYVYDVKQHESDRDFVFCFPPPADPSDSTAPPASQPGAPHRRGALCYCDCGAAGPGRTDAAAIGYQSAETTA